MNRIQIKLDNGFYLERAEKPNQFYYFLPSHVANIIEKDRTFHPLSSTGKAVEKGIKEIEEKEEIERRKNHGNN